MNNEALDLTPLVKAISQLQESLEYYHSDVVQADPGLVRQLRAAAIQAFEYTYELSWKMLKRYLKMIEPNPIEVEEMSFPDLIRTACERGLLQSEVAEWKAFRQDRSITSQTYDDNKAEEIFQKIPLFLEEVQYLHSTLQERIAKL